MRGKVNTIPTLALCLTNYFWNQFELKFDAVEDFVLKL